MVIATDLMKNKKNTESVKNTEEGLIKNVKIWYNVDREALLSTVGGYIPRCKPYRICTYLSLY